MHRERFKDFVLTEWHILDILSELFSLPFYLSVRNLLFLLLSKSKRLKLRWASTVCNEDFFFTWDILLFAFVLNFTRRTHSRDDMIAWLCHLSIFVNRWTNGQQEKKYSMMTLKTFSRILMWSSHVLVLWHLYFCSSSFSFSFSLSASPILSCGRKIKVGNTYSPTSGQRVWMLITNRIRRDARRRQKRPCPPSTFSRHSYQ